MMAIRLRTRLSLWRARFRVCPRDGVFGIQVPRGAWHSIEVHEASTIFEAKDGAYGVGK